MLIITDKIQEKIKVKHGINKPVRLVKSAFKHFSGLTLIDSREQHKLPNGLQTEWFVAKINKALYKIVFIRIGKDIIIRSAYSLENDNQAYAIYQAKAQGENMDSKKIKANHDKLFGLVQDFTNHVHYREFNNSKDKKRNEKYRARKSKSQGK